jgi:hypothetical protein
MSLPLKPISRASVAAALHKAERYRVINDPSSAESICLDILAVDPENEAALVTLILAITDQFAAGPVAGAHRAQELLPRLGDEYKHAYYAGIVCERCAKAELGSSALGAGEMAYLWLRDAMAWYEKAEALRPAGNDESILRWNTCARLLARNDQLRPPVEGPVDPSLE